MSRAVEITNDQEEQIFIDNNPRALIFFGSIKCSHCRNMVPVIDKMSLEYPSIAFGHVEVTNVDVENVNGVPVFVGYLNQVPIEVIEGARPEKLKTMLESLRDSGVQY